MSDDNQDKVQNQEEPEASNEPEVKEEAQTEELGNPSEGPENVGADRDQPSEEPKKAAVKPVSANLEKIIESIEKLSVLELADLVKALEERFGVTAAAPVAIAGAAPAAAAGEPVEEKTTFNVVLTNAGPNKIGSIKAVREIVPTLGLKEAKDLVESAPKPVLEGVNKATAEEAKAKLTAAGATVELQ